MASSGAASTSISRGSAGVITFSRRAAHGSVGPCTRVNTTTTTNTRSNSLVAPGNRALTGIVASTIGTAPRSPAQDRKACWRQGTRSGRVETITARGRAMSTRTDPATRAGTTAPGSRLGEASSPSMTNSPIWASQATPSAKPRVAGPCGSRTLPSTSAAR